jgi:hypothetical protein
MDFTRSFVVFCALLLLAGDAYAQEALGRLFTTPEDRVTIDRERQQAMSAPEKASATAVHNTNRIALNAVLIGYKKVIWVNQQKIDQQTEINGIMIDPNNVTRQGLWIMTASGKKLIKQGQVYLMNSGKVVERYEVS